MPVHIGQSDVLVPSAKPKPCSEYHGKDGFGDVPDFYPTINDVDMNNLKSETAVQARDIQFTAKTALKFTLCKGIFNDFEISWEFSG